MSVQILLTALERIENHESGEIIAKNDSCEECKHMIRIAEKALAEYEAAPDHSVVTCVYCGMEYPDGTPAAKAKILTEHIKVCTSHPMHAVTKERDELKRALDRRVERDAESVQSDSIVASCNCMTKTPDAKHHAKGCKYRLICERDDEKRYRITWEERFSNLKKERDDLLAALEDVVFSASPSPRDNPTMWVAWEQARSSIAKAKGGPDEQ